MLTAQNQHCQHLSMLGHTAWRSGKNLRRQDLAASDLDFMHGATYRSLLLHCRDAKTVDAGCNTQLSRRVPGTELKILRLACFGTPTQCSASSLALADTGSTGA